MAQDCARLRNISYARWRKIAPDCARLRKIAQDCRLNPPLYLKNKKYEKKTKIYMIYE
jgi:hypothetical protein